MRPIRRTIALCFVTAISAMGDVAFAVEQQLVGVPTGWRLQNYIYSSSDAVVSWYTGSSCANGQLIFESSVSQAVLDRYWSLIMSAKIAAKPIEVWYENVNGSCYVRSFLLREE